MTARAERLAAEVAKMRRNGARWSDVRFYVGSHRLDRRMFLTACRMAARAVRS